MLGRTTAAVVLGLGMAWGSAAIAQDTVKVGVILPYSGPFADAANQLQAGIDLYLATHGKGLEQDHRDHQARHGQPGGRRRLAQELVVRDSVDILAGCPHPRGARRGLRKPKS